MTTTPRPWLLVEANEHHGPFIVGDDGDVCDFYAMSQPGFLSTRNGGPSKPVLFSNAIDNAAFAVRCANSHDELVLALDGAPIMSAYHGHHGFEADRFIVDYEAWRVKVRAALARARGEVV